MTALTPMNDRSTLGRVASSIIIILLLVLGTVLASGTSANPVPPEMDIGGGTPYVEYFGPDRGCNENLSFLEEHLIFDIRDGKVPKASVEANYWFENRCNADVRAKIVLPFIRAVEDLEIRDGNGSLDFTYERALHNDLPIVGRKMIDYAASFLIDIGANNTTRIVAEYTRYYDTDTEAWTEVNELEYLTLTGALWSEAIQTARFDFLIPRDGLREIRHSDEYVKEELDDRVKMSIIKTEWVPKENVGIKWETLRTEKVHWTMGVTAIMLLALIPIFVVLFRKMRENRRSSPGGGRSTRSKVMGAWEGHSPEGLRQPGRRGL